MTATLATLLCFCGIGFLFYLNRDKSVKTSKALWIAIIWFGLIMSRPASMWITLWSGGWDVWNPSPLTVAGLDEGSPLDRLVFQALIVAGVAILATRRRRTLSVLKDNWPILLYFSFGLLSVAWSDTPDITIRRWIKATGDIVMVCLVVTDGQPVAAMRRLFSRIGFVHLPLSILFIRYFPRLGLTWDIWGGEPYFTGVSLDKNMLGVMALVLTCGTAWQILRLWRNPDLQSRSRQLLAQLSVLILGVYVLRLAHSATSQVCCVLICGFMVVAGMKRFRGRPAAIRQLLVTFVVLGVLAKLTGAEDWVIVNVIGRHADFTGRASQIWPALLKMAVNPLVGAGFESFWTGARMQKLWDMFYPTHINESHNGYLEVYLNLGLVGLALMSSIFIHGYRRSMAAFRVDPDAASFSLAYIPIYLLYNVTEAGFRMLNPSWSFFLLAIFIAGQIRKLSADTTSVQPELSSPDDWTEDGGELDVACLRLSEE